MKMVNILCVLSIISSILYFPFMKDYFYSFAFFGSEVDGVLPIIHLWGWIMLCISLFTVAYNVYTTKRAINKNFYLFFSLLLVVVILFMQLLPLLGWLTVGLKYFPIILFHTFILILSFLILLPLKSNHYA